MEPSPKLRERRGRHRRARISLLLLEDFDWFGDLAWTLVPVNRRVVRRRHSRRLTHGEVSAMRRLAGQGLSASAIARRFGIRLSVAGGIAVGERP